MIYQSIQPSLHLRRYIREYLLLHFVLDEHTPVPVKPYPAIPEQGITFYVRGFLLCTHPDTNTVEKRPQTVIFGQPVARQNLHPSPEYLMFNVRFQPGVLYPLVKVPMQDLAHQNIDAEAVFGTEIGELNNYLSNAPTYAAMLNAVEAFLWKTFQQVNPSDHPSDGIAKYIQDHPHSVNINALSAQACLSLRQLERNFMRQIGVTPIFFARMCRFQEAFILKERKPHLDWLSVAVHTGYHDYQHLVKDFKQFSGTTPNSLLEAQARSPERIILGVD